MIQNLRLGVLLPAFVLSAVLIFFVNSKMSEKQIAQSGRYICQLIYQKHYSGRSALANWYRTCMEEVQNNHKSTSELVRGLNQRLAKVPGSHLQIYTPQESEYAWEGSGELTGLDYIAIDGRILLWSIHPDQTELVQVLRRGDELLSIDSKPILTIYKLAFRGGKYKFRRPSGQIIEVQVVPRQLELKFEPELVDLKNQTGLLKIPSFRPKAFAENWIELSKKLSTYRKLYLDLRGNSGGSFVAMIRALSPFLCDNPHAGVLISPQVDNKKFVTLMDQMDPDPLLELIGVVQSVLLERLNTYPCYRGQISVLIDSESRSTAEIFAAALKGRKDVSILGQKSAGEVLLAVWYDLPLGPGYSLSIPESVYISNSGKALEGIGVFPDQKLFYNLKDAKNGVDSWLESN